MTECIWLQLLYTKMWWKLFNICWQIFRHPFQSCLYYYLYLFSILIQTFLPDIRSVEQQVDFHLPLPKPFSQWPIITTRQMFLKPLNRARPTSARPGDAGCLLSQSALSISQGRKQDRESMPAGVITYLSHNYAIIQRWNMPGKGVGLHGVKINSWIYTWGDVGRGMPACLNGVLGWL